MKIFLTGSTGVTGRRVIPQLIEAGHEVTAGGRQSARLQTLQLTGASVMPLDLFDSAAVKLAIAGQDAVINLATHVPPGLLTFLPGAWRENDRIRTAGSALLVNAALASDVQLFIQESFITYPDSADRWIDEGTPPDPPAYNQTVLDAENSATRFARSGRRGLALRFAFFYGSGDTFTRTTLKSVQLGWLPISGKAEGFLSMVNQEDAALSRSLRVSNAKLREATGWAPHYPSARELAGCAGRQSAADDRGHIS